jgi:MarR family transcriptional regulator for hemolysin
VPPPFELPIGLSLARAAKIVGRAFDDAMGEAGGSTPTWLVLLTLKTRQVGNQRELADVVGIQQATLTHHLNAMEAEGLLTRRRDPVNRRIHRVELTSSGEAVFERLRHVAVEFNQRLRTGISDDEVGQLRDLLNRLQANVAPLRLHDPERADAPIGDARLPD